MSDRVDNELRRVSTALAEVSPPKPDLPRLAVAKRKPQMLVAVASFIVVLGIGLAAGFLFNDASRLPASGIVEIPDGHVGLQVLEREMSYDDVGTFALDSGVGFACGAGGAGGVRSCVVWEDGVAVIIPFVVPDGVTVEVSTPSHDGRLEIPYEAGEPVGVRHDSGQFTVLHHVPGNETPFSYGSDFPASSAP